MIGSAGLGYWPDPPDQRDRPLATLGLDASPPPSASVERFMVSIPNQGKTNSCVGQAVRQALGIEQSRLSGHQAPPTSGLGHYYVGRIQHGVEDVDAGTWNRAVLKGLKYHGPMLESDWPFDANKVNVRPRWRAFQNAFDLRGPHAYYRIDGAADERLDAVRRAVASGHGVVFGTSVARSFLSATGPALIDKPSPNEEIVGGHAMCVVGYEPGKFLIANSWGTNWREHGRAWLTDDYLAWIRTQDIWVVAL